MNRTNDGVIVSMVICLKTELTRKRCLSYRGKTLLDYLLAHLLSGSVASYANHVRLF